MWMLLSTCTVTNYYSHWYESGMSKKRNTSNDGDDPTNMNTVIDGISINGNKITNDHEGTA